MLDRTGQDIGDGFNSAVGVPREAREIVLRNVVAEIVQKEKRIEVRCIAETKRPAQVNSRALEGRLGSDEPLDGSK